MKNILINSIMIFGVMTFLNFVMSILIVSLLNLPGGSYGMAPFLILMEGIIVSVIGFITVLIFKKSYHSMIRIAVLFEIIYLFSLIISGFNPFGSRDDHFFSVLTYANSGIVLLVIYLIDLINSKISFSKDKKLP
ncbi:hypothetical protein CEY12_11150 [Chryseobacterium sp. T16E-39]|uniref:hypothetical protein n=1 Tax=Chryseobacterium sp. T16E-39 TaxID=2015076 RepID=UPI000B5B1E20|nr:hypothetical protein [Chryseobacterium sp. T16E-39]ASK30634.1 hypothetical protein CEY12_11150 [Chryseobacterium sp. T16E-39]